MAQVNKDKVLRFSYGFMVQINKDKVVRFPKISGTSRGRLEERIGNGD
jgi:hypothetical protein